MRVKEMKGSWEMSKILRRWRARERRVEVRRER